MQSILKAGLILGLSFISHFAFAAPAWELVGEKDGIKVYRKEVPGSPLVAFKGVKVMPVPITKVAQVILDEDTEKKKQWIDMIKDFQIIEKGTYESITYSAYDLPWPLTDRDYVVHSHLKIDNEANQILIDLKSVEHPKAPKTIGVRAELVRSLYKLVPRPDGSTEVTVEIQTDPKGALPKWLVNLVQKGWPANTLRNMEVQALRPDTKEHAIIKAKFKGAHELAQR
ncbi:START domain-containing protein [Oligoflexus tunisiensis]|uniref:START domain-containing protein n=1 Tax=Oligoflexus tunisiensis TaxID=708132 RepID=UPI00159F1D29|nr:START domain-containing protein [Oligoflexus tunisiensis]